MDGAVDQQSQGAAAGYGDAQRLSWQGRDDGAGGGGYRGVSRQIGKRRGRGGGAEGSGRRRRQAGGAARMYRLSHASGQRRRCRSESHSVAQREGEVQGG